MSWLSSNRSRLVSETHSAMPPSVTANSQHQRQAAAALSDYSNEDILAWLKLVRSARNIEPIPEPRPGDAYLTPSEIQALVTLKNCPNDRLETHLLLARRDRLSDDLAVYNRILTLYRWQSLIQRRFGCWPIDRSWIQQQCIAFPQTVTTSVI